MCLASSLRHPSQRFRRRLWPTSKDDVLPGGAHVMVDALCFWLKTAPTSVVVQAGLAIYETCTEDLSTPGFTLRLLDAIHRHLDSAASDIGKDILLSPSYDLPEHRIIALAEFADGILFGVTTPSCDIMLFAPIADRVLNTLSRVLNATSDSTALQQLSRIGRLMRLVRPRAAGEGLDPDLFSGVPDGFRAFCNLLNRMTSLRACGWPECSLTERNAGRPMRLCGRCHVFRYCGEACQKQHWRGSHKTVCKGLRTFSAQIKVTIEPAMDPDIFVAACREVELDIDFLAELYGLMAVEDATMGRSRNPLGTCRTGSRVTELETEIGLHLCQRGRCYGRHNTPQQTTLEAQQCPRVSNK
ncbi:hypothetical protein EXIGLDRAFT_783235 [Exidia glandulosa HHB12029]|uniref:phytol kinase n=1 Tax=Exidia glandulosa HHB12029 TaxID=1314781 RepID=A0A166N6K6_EXIGL|nr:hypothetical protein EXIGLDRAFT_783235 [Exidia glandulosa HHB12029]